MSKLGLIKGILSAAASIGASAVVTNVIVATTPKNLNTINKVVVGIGGFVISSMVGAMAAEYVKKEIDDIAEQVTSIKAENVA